MIPVHLVSHFLASPSREGVVLLVGLRRPNWGTRLNALERALGQGARLIPVDLRELVRRRSDRHQRALRTTLRAVGGSGRAALDRRGMLLLVGSPGSGRSAVASVSGDFDSHSDQIPPGGLWSDL